MITPRQRRFLTVGLLALSPLAYLGSMLIEQALPARSNVNTIDDVTAVRIASDYARSRGVDTQGWQSVVGTEKDEKLATLLRHRKPAALEGIFAPVTLRVQLEKANGDRYFRVTLTPRGKVLGFQETRPKFPEAESDAATARAVADSALAQWLGPKPPLTLVFRPPSNSERHVAGTDLHLAGRCARCAQDSRHVSCGPFWQSRYRGALQYRAEWRSASAA